MKAKELIEQSQKSDIIKSVCLSANKGFCILGMKSGTECKFKGKCVHKQTVL